MVFSFNFKDGHNCKYFWLYAMLVNIRTVCFSHGLPPCVPSHVMNLFPTVNVLTGVTFAAI